jgi:hypothetical protein
MCGNDLLTYFTVKQQGEGGNSSVGVFAFKTTGFFGMEESIIFPLNRGGNA